MDIVASAIRITPWPAFSALVWFIASPQVAKRYPDHADARLVGQRADDGKQARDAQ